MIEYVNLQILGIHEFDMYMKSTRGDEEGIHESHSTVLLIHNLYKKLSLVGLTFVVFQ